MAEVPTSSSNSSSGSSNI